MTSKPYIIKGGIHRDDRGTISFVNNFNFFDVKRFYKIQNKSTKIIRAWQGHKVEKKYFFVASGSFLICVVKIDDWDNPSRDLPVEKFIMLANESNILMVSAGYANGIKALEEDSKLIVFSSNTLEDAKDDDYRFEANLWYDWHDKSPITTEKK